MSNSCSDGHGDAHDGETPVLTAARNGRADVLELLVAAGAEFRRLNEDGVHPLWVAACNGHADAVRVLANAGAPVHLEDGDGDTAVWAAA
eukprot:scaffold253610_cov48-Prasinocladus_malaysianus.AAC.1